MSNRRPPKRVMAALERVFEAEIDSRLPFQSKASIYPDLVRWGLVEHVHRTFGRGPLALTVSGYVLTHAGRYIYGSYCEVVEDE